MRHAVLQPHVRPPAFPRVRLGFLDAGHGLMAPSVAIWTDDAPDWAAIDPRLEQPPTARSASIPPPRPDPMFFNFVDELRAAGIPASFKEHLMLLEALDKDVIEQTPEEFYYLSRATS
jgi:hypothetical protein